jgi:hypothetical protein
MVSYPGRIDIRQGHHRGEAYIEMTIVDVRGRVEAVVVAIDPRCFGLALAGQTPQPCTITSAHYPPPPCVADMPQDMEESCE